MILFIILIVTEILTFVVIRQHFYDRSWIRYYFLLTVNSLLSLWLWITWFRTVTFMGAYDEPANISNILIFRGMLCGIVLPRIVILLLHFAGRAIKRKTGINNRIWTNSGLIAAGLIMIIIIISSTLGTTEIKTEKYEVKVKDLKSDLNKLKIVMISDLHLSSFYHQRGLIEEVVRRINIENPDIIVNTGDFVTYGWREFDRFDTILSKSKAKYGKFAVLGNHDMGTYHPYFTDADMENNVKIIGRLINASGYTLLKDETYNMKIGNSRLALTGIVTKGSFTRLIHGDLNKALTGSDSADFKILLAHDPNQWKKDVVGKTSIDLTMSGHTHGMQMGIYSKRLRWSPAKFFYSEWGGIYRNANQYLIVNRGLGVLGIPLRICMPPEITIITLSGA